MQLNEAQRQIQATARAFAERDIAPFAAEWDRAEGAPREVLWKMAQAGLMGVTIDPAYGGAGADFVSYVLAIEEIAAADGGLSNMMAANNSPVGTALAEHGSERQKKEYLSRITSGEWLGCIHLTEPHTGSDAAAIRTRAVADGDVYRLNGHKAFITAGASADLAMIVAVTDPEAGKRGISTFVTPTDNPGYKVIAKERKLGHRTNDTCQVVFEDMVVPNSDLLGAPGRGLGIALANLSAGRIGAAAQSTGGARAALKAAIAYARERETFGRKIIEHQAVAFKLADMATQVEAARQLYLHAAMLKDRGVDCAREASMAKLFASEMAERVASEAIQIHGGYGFLNDFPVEKIYRDVRVYQIYEGTSEVQRMMISRTLDGLDL
ncbi:acyl-CoA dehydrogenase family protein [Minwuia thermotolerans]|uniref:3-sulfinopropanoyl-CoA desulfinase n=1 Tax=Minwuia thermotolerans TaxID=2056226 RepID=A0A2M9G4S6_9PROT|nr:acyl-CoA dehydrogenase family protein [Minwuia thermotolerans]PJK30676.1 acyl-CoA dehydrogenase [Minwuia thermotolerans]